MERANEGPTKPLRRAGSGAILWWSLPTKDERLTRQSRGHTDVRELLPKFILDNYEVVEKRHAIAILERDFPEEFKDINEVMEQFRFHTSQVIVGGGGKTTISGGLEQAFHDRGWKKKTLDVNVTVGGAKRDSKTHEVDSFKGSVALEVEWNNKDPFFDRDLDNFRRLFDLDTLDVGVIITRCDELQDIFDPLVDVKGDSIGTKYGPSTTHMGKLLRRLGAGSHGGCPVLVLGISPRLYVEDPPDVVQAALEEERRRLADRDARRGRARRAR